MPTNKRHEASKAGKNDKDWADTCTPRSSTYLTALDDLAAMGSNAKEKTQSPTCSAQSPPCSAVKEVESGEQAKNLQGMGVVCCLGLLKVLLWLGLLLGVLAAALLALPESKFDVEGGDEQLSDNAEMGSWEPAFFCDDELQRAGRIIKLTNYIARTTGMLHGPSTANAAEACSVVRKSLVLTKQLHACVADLWRRRGVTHPVTAEMLGHPDAWWNAALKAAVKSASVAVLQQSQALHLILSHHLPWAVEALIERKVDINAAAGPCGLTPLLRAVRAGDETVVALLHRAGSNLSATDCRGCLAHHIAADTSLASKLRTWNYCGPSSSSEQCLRAHDGFGGDRNAGNAGNGGALQAQACREEWSDRDLEVDDACRLALTHSSQAAGTEAPGAAGDRVCRGRCGGDTTADPRSGKGGPAGIEVEREDCKGHKSDESDL